jgi:hypothetical protein
MTTLCGCLAPWDGRGEGVVARPLFPASAEEKCQFDPDLIFSVEDVLTAAEAESLVSFAEQQGFSTQFHEADETITYRHNDRIAIQDPEFAEMLWQRLQRHLPAVFDCEAVGCSSNVRLYKYSPGMRFGKHVDGSHEDDNGHESAYTVLIYLNDATDGALVGGTTAFYTGEYHDPDVNDSLVLNFAPQQGLALLHGHGERCLLHEGCAVSQGVKYLLRTDIMFAPVVRKAKAKGKRKNR